jgi:hypothetical protein
MENIENEKLIWEAPRLIINLIDETESGFGSVPSLEGSHMTNSGVFGGS